MKAVSLFLSLFFFSLIFLPAVQAYEIFSYNPDFDDDIDGLILFNIGQNQTINYNSTCYNAAGCFIAKNDYGNGTEITTSIYAIDTPAYPGDEQVTNGTVLAYLAEIKGTTITLPANQEAIVVISYYLNNTLVIDQPNPLLRIRNYDASGTTVITSEYLNGTANVWHNKTLISDVSNQEREILIDFLYSTDDTPTTLALDKFKVYTYDISEAREYWSSNYTAEYIRYCGQDASSWTGTTVGSNFTTYLNGAAGYMLADAEDDYQCSAFKIGNTTVARRLINNEGYGTSDAYRLMEYRDMYFNYRALPDTQYFVLFTELQLNNMELTVMKHVKSGNFYLDELISYDNSPTPYANLSTSGPPNSAIYYDYNGTIREDITTTAYFNDTVAGANWRLCGPTGSDRCVDFTAWHPFFASSFSCTPAIVCDPATNQQYVITIDCGITNQLSCGMWGCNDDLTGCDFGTVGSICLNDYTIQTTNATGYVTYEYCSPPDTCYNITSTTAECLSETEYDEYNYTHADLFENPSQATGQMLGALFGVTDTETAMMIFGFILVITVSVAVTIIYSQKVAKHGESAGPVFLITLIVMFVLVGLVGWIPTWIIVLLVIGVSLLFAKKMGLFGGG